MLNRDLFVSKDLPNPLAKEELIKLFKEYKEGNIEAKNKIVNHNIRLVIDLVSKQFNGYVYDQQELVSIGIIGLMNAVDYFDVDKNVAFSTYATKAIIMQILKELKKDKKRIQTISIEEKVCYNEDKEDFKLKDLLFDKNTDMVINYEKKELLNYIYNYIQKLDVKKRKILESYYFKNISQQKIAEKYNISDAYVSLIIRTELAKMKKILIAKKYVEINDKNTKKLIKS